MTDARKRLAERYGSAAAALESARAHMNAAIDEASDAGLSQREIGRIVGHSQPEIRRRLLRRRPSRTWPTMSEYAHGIAAELRSGDTDFAFRLVQQGAATARDLGNAEFADFARVKPLTGDERWDTLVQAVVLLAARRRGQDIAWAPPSALSEEWFIVPDEILRERTRRLAQPDLAALNIWVDARSLETA